VTFEPIHAPGARPGPSGELLALEDTETLARYNVGGSGDPDHPAGDPKFHPAPRVVVTLLGLAPRIKSKSRPLQAHARSRGYWPIRTCYEPGLRRDQALDGKTKIRITIASRGKVLGTRVLGGDLGDREVVRCLRRVLANLRFPAPGRKVDADWEIGLHPGDTFVPAPPVALDQARTRLPAPAAALEAALDAVRPELGRCLHTIEEAPMRMLVKVTIPHEPFNTAVRNGTAGETIQRIMGQIRPEAAYFTNLDGRRGAILSVDVADPSKVPAIAEPFFISFNADVQFHVVMSPEDLGKAGLADIGKAWAPVA
jgi:hypothetical protein